MLRNAESINK